MPLNSGCPPVAVAIPYFFAVPRNHLRTPFASPRDGMILVIGGSVCSALRRIRPRPAEIHSTRDEIVLSSHLDPSCLRRKSKQHKSPSRSRQFLRVRQAGGLFLFRSLHLAENTWHAGFVTISERLNARRLHATPDDATPQRLPPRIQKSHTRARDPATPPDHNSWINAHTQPNNSPSQPYARRPHRDQSRRATTKSNGQAARCLFSTRPWYVDRGSRLMRLRVRAGRAVCG